MVATSSDWYAVSTVNELCLNGHNLYGRVCREHGIEVVCRRCLDR